MLMKGMSKWGLWFGIIFFLVFIIFVSTHFADLENLWVIIKRASPWWLLLAIFAQLGTYVLTSLVWSGVARTSHYHIPLVPLFRVAVEQLTVNQLMPVAGLAGNALIVRTMKHFRVPDALAFEILFVDTLSYHFAFALVAFAAAIILNFFSTISFVITGVLIAFFIIETVIVVVVLLTANHKKLNFLNIFRKIKVIGRLLNSLEYISLEKIFSLPVLFRATFLKLGVFLFDVLTLWLVMKALGIEVDIVTSYVAMIIGLVAAIVSFIPGGIGSFEAACIGILTLLGIQLEGAIAGTVLLRGLTLWLPLIPGILMMRKDVILSPDSNI